MDLDENLTVLQPWKPLPQFSPRNLSPNKPSPRKSSASPLSSSHKNSISVELKANSPTSNTIHFNSLHSRYNTATLDMSPSHSELSESIEKKYINNITRLNEEILIMSTQLKQANETISSLTHKLNECNSNHALGLQSLHERHEQKIRRNKQDMDNLLKEFHSKNASLALEKIILEKNLELEVQRRAFQEKIDDMCKKFEAQLEAKEALYQSQIRNLKEKFLDVVRCYRDQLFEEVDGLQNQFRIENERIQMSFDKLNENVEEGIDIRYTEDMEDDLLLIEELSALPIFVAPSREFGESDLDLWA